MAILLEYEGKLALKCDFEEKEIAKSVPGWKWNPTMKVWEYPMEADIVRQLQNAFNGDVKVTKQVREQLERVQQRRQELLQVKTKDDATVGVDFADKLRNYQRTGAAFLQKAGRAILADDMGTGKTLQAITACEARGDQKVLIICPNTLKDTWKQEIEKWAGQEAIVVDGPKKKREQAIKQFEAGEAKYLIINYESARLHDELAQIDWETNILDEAHKIKNRKAQQTKAVKQYKADRVYLLTGTPMLNRAWELWSLLNRLYPKKFTSFWRFAERYCQVYNNGWGMQIDPGTKEQEQELREFLEPIMLRRTKEEVLTELPPKVYHRHLVELKGQQAKIYKQMEREAIAELTEEAVAAPVVIAKITRLRQIAISPQLLDKNIGQSAKFDALMDIIEENCQHRKIVVFSQFRKAIELFAPKLEEKGIGYAMVTGEVKQKDRAEATRRFQEDPETRVMLATIEAGGLGLTWTAADMAVFLDRHWTPGINTQAEDRLHRIGQDKSVDIINLVAKNTVEQHIENLLATKAKSFEAIINGKELDITELFGGQA